MSANTERAAVDPEAAVDETRDGPDEDSKRPAFRITRTELARLLREGYLTLEEC